MADVIRKNTVIGLEPEVTEGTYVAPSGTGSYIQTLPGYSWTPAMELLDRQVLSGGLGSVKPLLGNKTVTAALPVEFRASGTEGGQPDFHQLLLGALGATRNYASATTSTTSHTSTVINLTSGDGDDFAVGDMVIVKKSGSHEMRPISAKTTNSITFPFALNGGAPGNGVEISRFQTYYVAETGHPSLSVSVYEGNEMRACAIGTKVNSLSFDNFSSGQIASFNFGLSGLNYTYTNAAAPHTPAYDSVTPPIIVNACIWKSGVEMAVNSFSLSLTNELAPKRTTCAINSQVPSSRAVSGTATVYLSDTSTVDFDAFVAGTSFSLFGYAYNPSSTAGEIAMGSAVGFYLPNCITTGYNLVDIDGISGAEIAWRAHTGVAGGTPELYIGMV